MVWVQEKLPAATAQDYGQSLSSVRHLQEKHQVLAGAGREAGEGQPRGWWPQRGWRLMDQGQGTVDQHSLCPEEHLFSLEILEWKFLVSL